MVRAEGHASPPPRHPFPTPHRGPWGQPPQETPRLTKDIQGRSTEMNSSNRLGAPLVPDAFCSIQMVVWVAVNQHLCGSGLPLLSAPSPRPSSPIPGHQGTCFYVIAACGPHCDVKRWVLGLQPPPTRQGRPRALAVSPQPSKGLTAQRSTRPSRLST